ncbi:MAG TPA: basic amino acid ABC transporter substrate-binding protein [Desulfobacteria bacterium]|nr:basic amino acid ABC transporter substrate-binding protein [Desulfobacteria bacterium]
MKKSLTIVKIAILLLGLVFSGGCFQRAATTDPEDKIYKVAVTGGTATFNYLNKDGNLEGFESDLMNAIAKEEGFKVKYEITARAARIPALKAKQADVILAVMTITDERKKEVDFSNPYFEATLYILVPENSQIQSLEDLRGKTVACAMATTGDIALSKFLGKNYEGIKRFKDTSVGFLELTSGKADAAVGDCAIVTQYVKNNPGAKLRIVRDNRFPKEYYGMAVRKGDTETLQKINSGLKKIKDNGKYEQIYQKWFNN